MSFQFPPQPNISTSSAPSNNPNNEYTIGTPSVQTMYLSAAAAAGMNGQGVGFGGSENGGNMGLGIGTTGRGNFVGPQHLQGHSSALSSSSTASGSTIVGPQMSSTSGTRHRRHPSSTSSFHLPSSQQNRHSSGSNMAQEILNPASSDTPSSPRQHRHSGSDQIRDWEGPRSAPVGESIIGNRRRSQSNVLSRLSGFSAGGQKGVRTSGASNNGSIQQQQQQQHHQHQHQQQEASSLRPNEYRNSNSITNHPDDSNGNSNPSRNSNQALSRVHGHERNPSLSSSQASSPPAATSGGRLSVNSSSNSSFTSSSFFTSSSASGSGTSSSEWLDRESLVFNPALSKVVAGTGGGGGDGQNRESGGPGGPGIQIDLMELNRLEIREKSGREGDITVDTFPPSGKERERGVDRHQGPRNSETPTSSTGSSSNSPVFSGGIKELKMKPRSSIGGPPLRGPPPSHPPPPIPTALGRKTSDNSLNRMSTAERIALMQNAQAQAGVAANRSSTNFRFPSLSSSSSSASGTSVSSSSPSMVSSSVVGPKQHHQAPSLSQSSSSHVASSSSASRLINGPPTAPPSVPLPPPPTSTNPSSHPRRPPSSRLTYQSSPPVPPPPRSPPPVPSLSSPPVPAFAGFYGTHDLGADFMDGVNHRVSAVYIGDASGPSGGGGGGHSSGSSTPHRSARRRGPSGSPRDSISSFSSGGGPHHGREAVRNYEMDGVESPRTSRHRGQGQHQSRRDRPSTGDTVDSSPRVRESVREHDANGMNGSATSSTTSTITSSNSPSVPPSPSGSSHSHRSRSHHSSSSSGLPRPHHKSRRRHGDSVPPSPTVPSVSDMERDSSSSAGPHANETPLRSGANSLSAPPTSSPSTGSSKSNLTVALQKARSAVLLDQTNNIPAAVLAYTQAVRLLREVMNRVEESAAAAREKERLKREKEAAISAKERIERGQDPDDPAETDEEKKTRLRREKKLADREKARWEEARRLAIIHDTYNERIRILKAEMETAALEDYPQGSPQYLDESTPLGEDGDNMARGSDEPPLSPPAVIGDEPPKRSQKRSSQQMEGFPAETPLSPRTEGMAGIGTAMMQNSAFASPPQSRPQTAEDSSSSTVDDVAGQPLQKKDSPSQSSRRESRRKSRPISSSFPSIPSISFTPSEGTRGSAASPGPSILPLDVVEETDLADVVKSLDDKLNNLDQYSPSSAKSFVSAHQSIPSVDLRRQPVPGSPTSRRPERADRRTTSSISSTDSSSQDIPVTAVEFGADWPTDDRDDDRDDDFFGISQQAPIDPDRLDSPGLTTNTSRASMDTIIPTHRVFAAMEGEQRAMSASAEVAEEHDVETVGTAGEVVEENQEGVLLAGVISARPHSGNILSTSSTFFEILPPTPEKNKDVSAEPSHGSPKSLSAPRSRPEREPAPVPRSTSGTGSTRPTRTASLANALSMLPPPQKSTPSSPLSRKDEANGRLLISTTTAQGTISQRRKSPAIPLTLAIDADASANQSSTVNPSQPREANSQVQPQPQPQSQSSSSSLLISSALERTMLSRSSDDLGLSDSSADSRRIPSQQSMFSNMRLRTLSQPGKRPPIPSFVSESMPELSPTATTGLPGPRSGLSPHPPPLPRKVSAPGSMLQHSIASAGTTGSFNLASASSERFGTHSPVPSHNESMQDGETPTSAFFPSMGPNGPTVQDGNSPAPQLPAPVPPVRRPFQLLKQINASIASGAYLTPRLYIPLGMWRQGGIKLFQLDAKIKAMDALLIGLEGVERSGDPLIKTSPLPGAPSVSANTAAQHSSRLLKELDSFDGLLDNLRNDLSKKLPFIEGLSGKKSKENSFNSWTGKLSRGFDRMTNSKNPDATQAYVEVLGRLCLHAQILDQHLALLLGSTQDGNNPPPSPLLFPGSSSSVNPSLYQHLSRDVKQQLDLRLRRASDFFNAVVVRIVVRDVGAFLEKYVKRAGDFAVAD